MKTVGLDAELGNVLEPVEDTARQPLLKNVSTAVGKARKRLAGELHDDALQKLTVAELHLQRRRDPDGDATELLDEVHGLLRESEESEPGLATTIELWLPLGEERV